MVMVLAVGLLKLLMLLLLLRVLLVLRVRMSGGVVGRHQGRRRGPIADVAAAAVIDCRGHPMEVLLLLLLVVVVVVVLLLLLVLLLVMGNGGSRHGNERGSSCPGYHGWRSCRHCNDRTRQHR